MSMLGPTQQTDGTTIPGTLQASTDGGKTWVDVDASWDGKGSLDEHRQKVLAEIRQPGFGREGVKDGR